jgi:hypothetical protein
MRLATPLLILIRIIAPVLVILGDGFWTGHWIGLIPLHRTLGVVFVIALWALAGVVFAGDRLRRWLAAFAVAWGVVVAALGMAQQRILIGDFHWVVRVLHLAVAIVAMYLATLLTKPVKPSA